MSSDEEQGEAFEVSQYDIDNEFNVNRGQGRNRTKVGLSVGKGKGKALHNRGQCVCKECAE